MSSPFYADLYETQEIDDFDEPFDERAEQSEHEVEELPSGGPIPTPLVYQPVPPGVVKVCCMLVDCDGIVFLVLVQW
jgi:hypothetical protein